jgi:hypothetical protein
VDLRGPAGDGAAAGPADLDAWLAQGHDAAPPPADGAPGPAPAGDVGPASPPGPPARVTARLLATLRREPSVAERRRARRARKAAAKLQAKLSLEEAAEQLDAALAAWPADPRARYALATVLAFDDQPERALGELEVLHAIDTDEARQLVARAAADPDLAPLRDDVRFAALTRAPRVEVCWTPRVRAPDAVDQMVARLRSAGIAAVSGKVWRSGTTVTTVLHQRDNHAARAMAERISRAAALPPRVLGSKSLDQERPVVVVLTPSGAARLDPSALVTSLDDLLDKALTAQRDGAVERLTLKRTKFFEWVTERADGGRIERTGRYIFIGSELSFSYRLTTSAPASAAERPNVRVEQGRRSSHRVALVADGLLIDGVRFTAGR